MNFLSTILAQLKDGDVVYRSRIEKHQEETMLSAQEWLFTQVFLYWPYLLGVVVFMIAIHAFYIKIKKEQDR